MKPGHLRTVGMSHEARISGEASSKLKVDASSKDEV